MASEEMSIFFEVILSIHPTKFDKIGCDGIYIKSIEKIDTPLGKLLFGDKDATDRPKGVLHMDEHFTEAFHKMAVAQRGDNGTKD